MKFEVKNIVIAIFLFVTGSLSGNALNFPIAEIYSISNLLSLLGILVTVAIGISALHTWKHQFQHTECYKAAIQLELTATEYLQNFHDYRYAYLVAAKNGIQPEEMHTLAEYEVQKSSYIKYVRAWSLLQPFTTQKIFSEVTCNPEKLQRELTALLIPITYHFKSGYDPAKDPFDESILLIRDKTISNVRSFRNAANK